jgi:hypothetical protein
MSLFDRVYKDLESRRNRILNGKVNCIPWNLPRFEEFLPGIEQGKYYIITANSKVGKSQITDWLFMYNAFRQIKEENLPIKLKIVYFSLEMSSDEKLRQMISNLMFLKSNKTVIKPPKVLRSTKSAVSEQTLKEISHYSDYIQDFLKCVTFIDDIRNPYGIYQYMREYAMNNGTMHKKTVHYNDEDHIIDDYYEPNDPEEYVIPLVDHASLLTPEKTHNGSIRSAIGDLSSNWFVKLRNKYKQSPVLIQQQASAQESVENMKAGRLRPTLDGLAENKTTQRDADVILGLFSPFRHKIPEYEGFDIKFFKDNIRFLEIIGGREGGAGTISPLYFNGAVNFFNELPKSNNELAMLKVNEQVVKWRNYERQCQQGKN